MKFPKKTTTAQKNSKKRGAKEEQYLEDHIEKTKVCVVFRAGEATIHSEVMLLARLHLDQALT